MTLPFTIKEEALEPVLTFAFTVNGLPLDLTGHTVTVSMRKLESTTNLSLAGSVVVDTPNTLGTGYYAWGTGDTEVPGQYEVEWYIDNLTLPTAGYDRVTITPSFAP